MRATGMVVAAAVLAVPSFALAQTASPLTLRPVILGSDNGEGTTLALEYTLDGKYERSNADDTAGFVLEYKGEGTIATSADRNPRDFLDLQLSGSAYYEPTDTLSFAAGGFVKGESDQRFKNAQVAYGGRVRMLTTKLLGDPRSELGLSLLVGEVDPGDDEVRKAALRVSELKTYSRLEFEALYRYRVNTTLISDIELNYRRFQELDAPAAIRSANLRVHELGIVRVNLSHPFFVAYTTGKLPFDLKRDETVAFGFKTNVQNLAEGLGTLMGALGRTP